MNELINSDDENKTHAEDTNQQQSPSGTLNSTHSPFKNKPNNTEANVQQTEEDTPQDD